MKKVARAGFFASIGITLGIFGILIGMSFSLSDSSNASGYEALTITDNDTHEGIDEFENLDPILQPYFNDYYVTDYVTLPNNEGYFLIYEDELDATIEGIEVTTDILRFLHLGLNGYTAWQHSFVPSEDFRLASQNQNLYLYIDIEDLFIEDGALVFPVELMNTFTYFTDEGEQSIEIGGNVSMFGVSQGDYFVSSFIKIDLETYVFTTLNKKVYDHTTIEIEEIHRVAQYRYLIDYDFNREFTTLTDPNFLGLDLNTLPEQGHIISEVIVATDENDALVFSETLYSAVFSDEYIDIDFNSFYLVGGGYRQVYKDYVNVNVEFEFEVIFDENNNPYPAPQLAFLGQDIFSTDAIEAIYDVRDEVYGDTSLQSGDIQIDLVLSIFDRDVQLEVITPLLQDVTGNEHSVDTDIFLDLTSDELYVATILKEYNYSLDDNRIQLIDIHSIVDIYTFTDDGYQGDFLVEVAYGVFDIAKVNGGYVLTGYASAFEPIGFDNEFVESVLVVLYDEDFVMLDAIAIYGNEIVYQELDIVFLSATQFRFVVYTASTEGFPLDVFTGEFRVYSFIFNLS